MASTRREAGQEQIDEIVARIVAAVRPLRIILFGSAARGDSRPGGDVDVMVVMPEGTHRLGAAQDLQERMIGVGVAVDIIVCTPQDLQQYGETIGLIYRTVLREGRELYVA